MIDLGAGGSATITLTLPPGTTGEINNVSAVSPDPSIVDPNSGNDLDTDNKPTTPTRAALASGQLVGIGVVVPHLRPGIAQLAFLHELEGPLAILAVDQS